MFHLFSYTTIIQWYYIKVTKNICGVVYIGRTFYSSTNLGTSGEKGVDLWYNFGLDGAKPLVGDFNRDGYDDIAVYIGRTFYSSTNLGASGEKGVDLWYNFGLDGAKPLVGDFG